MSRLNKQLAQAANRKATITIFSLSIAIAFIIRKFGREKKD